MLESVKYLGVEVSAQEVKPVAEKLDAVLEAPQPQNQQQLRSFLGGVNFYGHFVPEMATVAAPLNSLLQKNVTWKWTREEESCFKELKKRLATAPILAHYNPKQLCVQVNVTFVYNKQVDDDERHQCGSSQIPARTASGRCWCKKAKMAKNDQ